MEEKKLNIEETIKALECCERGNAKCSACPRNISDNELRTPDCRDELRKQALDLIHRLQDKNDRLTEENEHLDMVAKQALADYHGYVKSKKCTRAVI